jgi:hypothetical protein
MINIRLNNIIKRKIYITYLLSNTFEYNFEVLSNFPAMKNELKTIKFNKRPKIILFRIILSVIKMSSTKLNINNKKNEIINIRLIKFLNEFFIN